MQEEGIAACRREQLHAVGRVALAGVLEQRLRRERVERESAPALAASRSGCSSSSSDRAVPTTRSGTSLEAVREGSAAVRRASARPSEGLPSTTITGRLLGEREPEAAQPPRTFRPVSSSPSARPTARSTRDATQSGSGSAATSACQLLIVRAHERLHDLAQRPVGDAFAVRDAMARRDTRASAESLVGELAHEPRFPDARLPR